MTKPDGAVVRTLWGELAYQLGGSKAFARIAKDDERATSPGDVLRELFVEYGPCLVLIDEWVAYARQLHDQSDLPAGGFETQFTFAQALTELAKLAKNCLLVVSLPASDSAGSPHAHVDDVEVGGIRGRAALDRLAPAAGRRGGKREGLAPSAGRIGSSPACSAVHELVRSRREGAISPQSFRRLPGRARPLKTETHRRCAR